MTSWTQNNLTLAPPSERGCPAGRPPPWCPFHPRPRRPVKPSLLLCQATEPGQSEGVHGLRHTETYKETISDIDEVISMKIHVFREGDRQSKSFTPLKRVEKRHQRIGMVGYDQSLLLEIWRKTWFKDLWQATIFGQAGAFDTTMDPIKVSLSKDLHKNDLEQPPKLLETSKSLRLWLCDTLRLVPRRRLVVFKGIVRRWTLIESDGILIQGGRGQKGLEASPLKKKPSIKDHPKKLEIKSIPKTGKKKKQTFRREW